MMDQPPAIIQPAVSATGLVVGSIQPQKLSISNLVTIDLRDGSMSFQDGYEPTRAARAFWEAMSQEYRDMLKWKAEHKPSEHKPYTIPTFQPFRPYE